MEALDLNHPFWHRRRVLWITMALLGMVGCRAEQQREVVIAVPVQPLSAPEPEPTAAQKQTAPWVMTDEIYTVYSRDLIIGANPNQRFLGHLLRITGVFAGVNRSLPGQTYLELRTHNKDAFAYAALSPDAQSLLTGLTLGTRLELFCWGAGAVGGSPLLRDCRPR